MTFPTQPAAPPSLIERVRAWYRQHIHARPEAPPVQPAVCTARCRRPCRLAGISGASRAGTDRPTCAALVSTDSPPDHIAARLRRAHRVVVAARAAAAVTALAQAQAAGLLDAEQPDFVALTGLMRRMPDYRVALAELEDCRVAAHGPNPTWVSGDELSGHNSALQCGQCGSPLVTPHSSLRW